MGRCEEGQTAGGDREREIRNKKPTILASSFSANGLSLCQLNLKKRKSQYFPVVVVVVLYRFQPLYFYFIVNKENMASVKC